MSVFSLSNRMGESSLSCPAGSRVQKSHQGSCTLYLSALLAFSLLHPQTLSLPMEAMWPLEVPEKDVNVFAETFGEKSYGRFWLAHLKSHAYVWTNHRWHRYVEYSNWLVRDRHPPLLCGRRVESAFTKSSRENRTIVEWERGSFPKGADETQSSDKHHSTPLNRMPSRQQ